MLQNTVLLLQGFDILPEGGIVLISDVVREMLKIDCSVMMGANLAGEVAAGNFCESTIGKYCLYIFNKDVFHPSFSVWLMNISVLSGSDTLLTNARQPL